MAMRFDEDVVIVTGAGQGLGREYALAFAAHGGAVVVNDIDEAAAVVQEIKASGGRVIADTHSIATRDGAGAIVQAAIKTFGKVTVLVNNAGIISFAKVADITDEEWRNMQTVTLDGAFHMCASVWPHMAAQRYGRIVNTTSNAGFAGNETLGAYGAAVIVAPTVLWLASRQATINGEIFFSSSGKVVRVGFVVGEGYFNPDHGPEDLAENADQICTLGDYLDPQSSGDELLAIPPLLVSR